MDLTSYVQEVSRQDFQKEFRHQAFWNKRLRTTGGRFFPQDGHLDFNPRIYQEFDLATFRKIVAHELCHYHLYYEGRGYRHGDRDFKALLAKVGGLRYAPSLNSDRKSLIYRCKNCKMVYYRQRKVNLEKYRCGRCRGRLERTT
ncbi:SprT family protein [Streptococcus oricebi]|uniref:Protein SprT-like n=1 Tax=Streptococcus oricebi TaxID=1547447 RepID=A0ABS5B347_9STRE|nr:SprT family protein [Streptococcus oricebi]MBP2622931.1 SprT family protein [Streptococcus oricebi]